MIHDGTHGVLINPRIIMRDQMRCPGVPEQRQVMRYFKDKGTSVFALKGDVSKAHRRVAILEEDWGMQACRLDEHRVWLNPVGTLGIGSAACWWSRLIGGVARLTLYLLREAVIWQLTFANDLEWIVQGPDMVIHLVPTIYSRVVMGVPSSWPKFGGGTSVKWAISWTTSALQ